MIKQTTSLHLIQGDITKVPADVIVNAANSDLSHGGGVCGAIFNQAGAKQMSLACGLHGHCPTGYAVVTSGFNLPHKYCIHAVAPMYSVGKYARDQLESVHMAILSKAKEVYAKSMVLPAMATGVYGYPATLAAHIALSTVKREIELGHVPYLEQITFVLYDNAMLEIFGRTLAIL